MTETEGTGRPDNKTRWLSKGLESLIYENRKSRTAFFDIVVIGSGDALMAVLPLSRSDLGRDAPLRLVERAA